MRKWSKASQAVYDTLDPKLQRLVTRLRDEVIDITLICGHRGEAEQNEAVRTGHSKVKWPEGKHNKLPSVAVDLRPYPFSIAEPKQWAQLGYLAAWAIVFAREDGFEVRWGGDWDRDNDLTDQTFDDLFHLEIVA